MPRLPRSARIQENMANESNLPTSSADKNWPKGPNFKTVVYGFLLAILVVVVLGILLISKAGKRIFPMNTRSTPSQTYLVLPIPAAPLTTQG